MCDLGIRLEAVHMAWILSSSHFVTFFLLGSLVIILASQMQWVGTL